MPALYNKQGRYYMLLHRRPTVASRPEFDNNALDGVMLAMRLPEGTAVAVVLVLSFLALVLPSVVSSTQVAQVSWETVLVGTWYTTLLEESSDG